MSLFPPLRCGNAGTPLQGHGEFLRQLCAFHHWHPYERSLAIHRGSNFSNSYAMESLIPTICHIRFYSYVLSDEL